MSEEITFSIDESTGNTRFLMNNLASNFINETSVIRRASHVEPANILWRIPFNILRWFTKDDSKVAQFTRTWACKWRVNLKPVNGPILDAHWGIREFAIQAEIDWLKENFL